MGNKTNPTGIRLGITADWLSRWFANSKKSLRVNLRKDVEMRAFIEKQWKSAAIASVERIVHVASVPVTVNFEASSAFADVEPTATLAFALNVAGSTPTPRSE